MKPRMTPQEVAKALMECPEDAAVVCLYNITNEVCNVVYCPQNNAVYLTDDANWVVDFLIEDLETDNVAVITWYAKGE
jgi:hypothetical protein